MTGLWQVLGRSRLNYSRRMRLDVILVRRASPVSVFLDTVDDRAESGAWL